MSKKYYIGVDDIMPIFNTIDMDDVNYLEGVKIRIGNRDEYFPCAKYEVFIPDECRKQAFDEVWDFIQIWVDMNASDQFKCFGVCGIRAITKTHTYEEVKAKYKAWIVGKNTVKEMTVEEISKALGYDVKIVSKHE